LLNVLVSRLGLGAFSNPLLNRGFLLGFRLRELQPRAKVTSGEPESRLTGLKPSSFKL